MAFGASRLIFFNNKILVSFISSFNRYKVELTILFNNITNLLEYKASEINICQVSLTQHICLLVPDSKDMLYIMTMPSWHLRCHLSTIILNIFPSTLLRILFEYSIVYLHLTFINMTETVVLKLKLMDKEVRYPSLFLERAQASEACFMLAHRTGH